MFGALAILWISVLHAFLSLAKFTTLGNFSPTQSMMSSSHSALCLPCRRTPGIFPYMMAACSEGWHTTHRIKRSSFRIYWSTFKPWRHFTYSISPKMSPHPKCPPPFSMCIRLTVFGWRIHVNGQTPADGVEIISRSLWRNCKVKLPFSWRWPGRCRHLSWTYNDVRRMWSAGSACRCSRRVYDAATDGKWWRRRRPTWRCTARRTKARR